MSHDAPPPPPSSPYGGAPQASPRNTLAIWSMVLGFVSVPFTCLCGVGVVLGLAAIVLGWRAKEAPTGRGMAIAGIVTGAISVVLIVAHVVMYATGALSNPRAD